MKKPHTVLLKFLICLLLTACSSSPVDEVINENNVLRPTAHSIKAEESLFVDRIGVYDTLLVVINRKTEPIFYVYDNRSFAFKGCFGKIGHGPDDFQFPFFVNNAKSEDGILELYDVNAASFKKVPLKQMLDKVANGVISEKMSSQLIGSPNLTRIGRNDMVGNFDNGKGLFFMYEGDDDAMRWIEFPAILQQPKDDFTVMNMNRIAIHSQSHKVVSAMGYYNLLFLYNDSGVLGKTVQIGDIERRPIVMGEFQFSEDTYICSREVVATDEYVYVLMQNIKETDFGKNDNPPSRILVFDWNLNYLKTYELPHYSMTFALDESQDRIIYTALDEEGGTELYYIALDK